jgi:hypothetical protein
MKAISDFGKNLRGCCVAVGEGPADTDVCRCPLQSEKKALYKDDVRSPLTLQPGV